MKDTSGFQKAMSVRTVVSPGGIEAWLVEDSALPMFVVRYAFSGGSSQDPVGKEGLSNLVALVLGQGGSLAGPQFHRRVKELAVRIGFATRRDALLGNIETLTETRGDAAQLVNPILTNPRFADEEVERMRARLLGYNSGEARHPMLVAEAQWHSAAFPGHPQGRVPAGSEASIYEITAHDLQAYCERLFTRDNLKVVVVGDITASELSEFLDRLFQNLAPHADGVEAVPSVHPVTGGRMRVTEMDIPQSIVMFGGGSVAFDSPDFIPAYVLNHIVGNNGLSSRLATEIRRKRGLSYEIGTWLEHHPGGVTLRGRIATRNGMAGQALDVVRDEMQRIADGELSQQELEDAKAYLVESYPIVFDSNGKLASQLLRHALDGFGPDFLEERKALIAAVTLDQLKQTAKGLLDPENLIVSIVGMPALQPPRIE